MGKRVALVTGGMGGIGKAICRELFDRGYRVIAAYSRPHDVALTWQAQEKSEGYEFDIAYGDVSSFESCEAMVNKIKADIGPIEILINNAGITHDATCSKMKKEDWDDVIKVDLNSVFYVTHAVINDMKENKFGRIVNVSSINGQRGQYGQVNYSAAKAGMHGFTMALSHEVAKEGITVNTVSPGYVETDMILSIPKAIRNKILAEILMGRFAKPEEIAHVIAFLVEDRNGYITGANIPINGAHFTH